jgi:oligosaccharide repeat unit polymerase
MSTFLFLFFSLFTTIFLYDGNSMYFSDKVYITSLFIIYFSLYHIFSNDKRPYSLNKIFYLFCFFFFGVAPFVQLNAHVSFFGARLLTENEYFIMNMLILIIMISYQFLYRMFSKSKIDLNTQRKIRRYNIEKLSFKQNLILIILSLFSFGVIFYINNFNVFNLLLRGGELKSSGLEIASSTSLIITQFIRPIPMIALFFYLVSKSRNYLLLFILFPLAILSIFPLGVPRFYAAAIYIPLLLLLSAFIRKKNMFSLFFIGGLLIVFPFLNQFRHFSAGTSLKFGLNFDMFAEGHFDSYQNFALIVTENIITWGRQLLGVALFWVPRTFWPTKPVGSGHHIAEELSMSFSNISANFFAEGYINFGFLGIFLFVFFLAWFTARMDNIYWEVVHEKQNNFFRVIYYLMLGMLFFIMRGDLLSSFAFTVGIILSILFTFKVTKSK